MKPISEYIKNVLVEKAVGTFAGNGTGQWSINVSTLPEKPDLCIAIFEIIPSIQSKFMRIGSKPFQSKSITIQTRGTGYLSAHEKTQEIEKALDRIGRFRPEASDVCITNILTNGDAFLLFKDENNRFVWSQNFEVKYQQDEETE